MKPITDKILKDLPKLVALTGSVRPALDYLDIAFSDYKEWKVAAKACPPDDKARALIRLIKKAKAKLELKASLHLSRAGKKDFRAALAVLERRQSRRWNGKAVQLDDLRIVPKTSIVGVDVGEITK